jgi:hypothetical protein
MKRILGLYVAWLIAAVMLILAVIGQYPYGFYKLLRWICCAVFVYSAFKAQEEDRIAWAWIFGALAVLFNPIVLVHLQRDTWQIIDWITISVIVVAGIVFWPSGVFSQQFHFAARSDKNDALYDAVAKELQAQTMVPGLWTKAFAEAGGQMDRGLTATSFRTHGTRPSKRGVSVKKKCAVPSEFFQRRVLFTFLLCIAAARK